MHDVFLGDKKCAKSGHQGAHEMHNDDHDDDEYDHDDDADDDDDDDDDDARAHQGHSGLHACMSFASRALHQNVGNRSSQLLLLMKHTSTCLKKKLTSISPCIQGSKMLERLPWFPLSLGLQRQLKFTTLTRRS